MSSHTKDSKMVLDASLHNIQHNKVCIKDKVEQSRERSSALSHTPVLKLLKREPSATLANFYKVLSLGQRKEGNTFDETRVRIFCIIFTSCQILK